MNLIFEEFYKLFSEHLLFRIAVTTVVSIFLAILLNGVLFKLLMRYAKKSETTLDETLIAMLRVPVFTSVLLAGASYIVFELELGEQSHYVIMGIIKTIAVLVWARAAIRLVSLLLQTLSDFSSEGKVIQPTTLPFFEMVSKIAVFAGIVYFGLVSWNINVTGWLASAGIAGIAIGFAAKDTLANLFAGIFIVTDAPYKVGDFIILDGALRGVVTHIGIRSTRLLTRDDVEVTVPNATIANSRIVNETSGPHEFLRIRCTVEVAYGSDVDQVKEILLGCVTGLPHVVDQPHPTVRFREFGASGLVFQVRAYIEEPLYKGRTIDRLNTRIYKALNEANIEIPYSKHDLYLKEMPAKGAQPGEDNSSDND